MTQPLRPQAFTLIELLVVITILVVLLALLTPALEKAVYQAQLAVCASKLDGLATGAITYTVAYRRMYPHRIAVFQPVLVRNGNASQEDRPVLTKALGSLNDMLNDPLSAAVDFERQDIESWHYVSYPLWFGFQYLNETKMARLGDGFTWTNQSSLGPRTTRFSLLATDRDEIQPGGDVTKLQLSHPDPSTGVMHNERYQEEDMPWLSPTLVQKVTTSFWTSRVTAERGPIDANYAYDDGSVARYDQVLWDDERMEIVPAFSDGGKFPDKRLQLPQ